MLFLARDGMRGQLIDLDTQTVLRNYAIGEVSRYALAYSPTSHAVIAHQTRNCALFLSATTQQPLQRSFTPERVTSCAVTHCGAYMVAGTENGTVLLWNLQSGELIKNHKGHLRAIHCVAISADNSLVATASEDSVCTVWTLAALASLRMREVAPRCIFTGHSLGVTCCAFLRNTNVLLTGSNDRTCRLVDPNSGEQLRSITVGDAVTAVTVGLDDNALVLGTQKGFLHFSTLYEPSSQLPVGAETEGSLSGALREAILRPPSADGHHSPIVFLQLVSSKPSLVLTASEGGSVHWYDIHDGRLVQECVSASKGRLLGCCIVPRVAQHVKGSCVALLKNPVDPSQGHYHVTEQHLMSRPLKQIAKQRRDGESGPGAAPANDDADAGAMAAIRAETEELSTLRLQLQRRLAKLSGSSKA